MGAPKLNVHIALVSGGAQCQDVTTFSHADCTQMLSSASLLHANSAPKMKSVPRDGEIDILIATDCISEAEPSGYDLLVDLTFTGTSAHHPALRPDRPDRQSRL